MSHNLMSRLMQMNQQNQTDTVSTEEDVLIAFAHEDMLNQLEQVSETEYRIERTELPSAPLFLN